MAGTEHRHRNQFQTHILVLKRNHLEKGGECTISPWHYVKDNCIDEIFLCSLQANTLFYNQDSVLLK